MRLVGSLAELQHVIVEARVKVLEWDARDAASPVRMGDVRALEIHVTRAAEKTEAALSLRLTEFEMAIRRATAKAPRKKREG